MKLSDLPLLKRWEIASESIEHQGRIGRKYKNLDAEVKRSQEWEGTADLTAYDLGAGEDPQRVALDLHSPRSNLELSNPTKRQYISENKNKLSARNKRRLIALKPFLPKEANTNSKKRSRRSLDNFPQMEDEAVEEEYEFLNNPNDGGLTYENEAELVEEADETQRIKRAVDIGNAIKRAKLIQSRLSNFKNIHFNDGVKNKNKRSSGTHEEIMARMMTKPQRSNGVKRSTPAAITTITSTTLRNGIKVKPTINNQQKKDKIQKSTGNSESDNHNLIRHIVPQRSSIPKSSSPVDVKIVSKSKIDSILSSSASNNVPKEKQSTSEKAVGRQHISLPKEPSSGINTANVARAVAVAMEQLKRDQMWGKVFVHVRPSGELKVMVQETRKMNDDNK